MTPKTLKEKIGFKPGQRVLELDLPAGIADPFAGEPHKVAQAKEFKGRKASCDLVLAFATESAALTHIAKTIPALVDDGRLWIAYPKKSSGIPSDLTRDEGWKPLFDAGYIVVAIASVDAAWSAVRFRHRDLVQSIRYGKGAKL